MQGKSITLLLAEDSEAMCRAIRTVLTVEPRIAVVAEGHDMHQTLRLASLLRPDVVLLDLHMPGEFEPSMIRAQLCAASKRVIALSFSYDDEAKELALQYGASTLLDKTNLTAELIPVVLASARGVTA